MVRGMLGSDIHYTRTSINSKSRSSSSYGKLSVCLTALRAHLHILLIHKSPSFLDPSAACVITYKWWMAKCHPYLIQTSYLIIGPSYRTLVKERFCLVVIYRSVSNSILVSWRTVPLRLALQYNVSIEEKRFAPRAMLDETDRQQPRNITLLPGEETCEHVYFHVMVRAHPHE